jgi:hypothetical protein
LGAILTCPVAATLAESVARAAASFRLGACVEGVSGQAVALAKGVLAGPLAGLPRLATVALLALTALLAGIGAALRPSAAAEKLEKPATANETVTVRGRVFGADGKPAVGARLFLWPRPAGKAPVRLADREGKFQFAVPRADVDGGGVVLASAAGQGPGWTTLAKAARKEVVLRLVKDDQPIEGRLLNLEGQPVAGALVKIQDVERREGDEALDGWMAAWERWRKEQRSRGNPPDAGFRSVPAAAFREATVRSDKDGRFRLTGFGRERIVHLEIQAPRLELTNLSVLTRAKLGPALGGWHQPATFTRTIGPGKVMSITATDRRTGKPAAGVPFNCGMVMARTDAQGKCRLEGLSKRKEHFIGWGGFSSPYFFLLKPVADSPGLDEIRANIEVESGLMLSGRLLDTAGKPVRGLVVYMAAMDNPNAKRSIAFGGTGTVPAAGRSNARGEFSLPVLPGAGWLCVTANDADAYAPAEAKGDQGGFLPALPHPIEPRFHHAVVKVTTDAARPDSFRVDLRVQPARSRVGKALDADGKPLAGCLCAGLAPIGREGGRFREMQKLAGTEFTVRGLVPGRVRAIALFHLERGLGKVAAVRGDETGPVEVRLEPLAGLSGRVVGADGKPRAGLKVQARPTRRFAAYQDVPREVMRSTAMVVAKTTDKDGKFSLAGLLPGVKYDLVVQTDPSAFPPARQEFVSDLAAGKVKELGELKIRE